MNKLQTVYIPTSISTSKLQVGKIDESDYYKSFDKTTNVNEVEAFVFTPEELKPLQDIVTEGYNPFDEYQCKKLLKIIENFLNKEK